MPSGSILSHSFLHQRCPLCHLEAYFHIPFSTSDAPYAIWKHTFTFLSPPASPLMPSGSILSHSFLHQLRPLCHLEAYFHIPFSTSIAPYAIWKHTFTFLSPPVTPLMPSGSILSHSFLHQRRPLCHLEAYFHIPFSTSDAPYAIWKHTFTFLSPPASPLMPSGSILSHSFLHQRRPLCHLEAYFHIPFSTSDAPYAIWKHTFTFLSPPASPLMPSGSILSHSFLHQRRPLCHLEAYFHIPFSTSVSPYAIWKHTFTFLSPPASPLMPSGSILSHSFLHQRRPLCHLEAYFHIPFSTSVAPYAIWKHTFTFLSPPVTPLMPCGSILSHSFLHQRRPLCHLEAYFHIPFSTSVAPYAIWKHTFTFLSPPVTPLMPSGSILSHSFLHQRLPLCHLEAYFHIPFSTSDAPYAIWKHTFTFLSPPASPLMPSGSILSHSFLHQRRPLCHLEAYFHIPFSTSDAPYAIWKHTFTFLSPPASPLMPSGSILSHSFLHQRRPLCHLEAYFHIPFSTSVSPYAIWKHTFTFLSPPASPLMPSGSILSHSFLHQRLPLCHLEAYFHIPFSTSVAPYAIWKHTLA